MDTKKIKEKIKYLAADKGLNYGQLIELVNKKYDKSYTLNAMTNKFSKGTIRFEEIFMLLDVLDYDIEFVKRKEE